jgi:hypothetical protein
MEDEPDLAPMAGLTRLTRLALRVGDLPLRCALPLSSLRELRLHTVIGLNVQDLRQIVGPLTQLRALSLDDYVPDVGAAELDLLLATLPATTRLDMKVHLLGGSYFRKVTARMALRG